MIKELIYLLSLLYDSPLEEAKKKVYEELEKLGVSKNLVEKLVSISKRSIGESESSGTGLTIQNKKLYSIFECLDVVDSMANPEYTLPQKTITFDRAFFPSKDGFIQNDEQLWIQLSNAFSAMNAYEELRAKGETFLQLLHQYTACIPAPSGNGPGVSYFDYVKTLASNTIVLYDYLIEKNRFSEGFEIGEEEEPLVLIAGDLSGIQTFISDIVSKSAAKNLKGRSFYLQLLVESIIQEIKKECGLFDANVVYDSGGGFLLLAPNIEKVNKAFDKKNPNSFIRLCTLKLYHTHKTAFHFSIVKESYQIGAIRNNFDQCLQRIFEEKLSKAKQKPFHSLLEGNGPLYNLFEPSSADVVRDKITGDRISETDLKESWFFDLETSIFPKPASDNQQSEGKHLILKETADQIFIGAALKDADYWVISDQALSFFPKRMAFQPCNFGVYHYLIPEKYIKQEQLKNHTLCIYRINDVVRFYQPDRFGNNQILGFRLYGGKGYPQDKLGDSKTFNELAGSSEEEDFGFKRLGVLRMDIDNLSAVFKSIGSKGLAFYASLSRNLDHFFKGYLYHLWESNEEYKAFSQIIYAGGDDLFAVGRWDLMLKMAKEIKLAFADWTCHNPKLSISGGMAVVTHKFPIIKAAELSAAEEGKAKNWFYKTDQLLLEKNSFSVFGTPLHWTSLSNEEWLNEFSIVEEFKKGLLDLMKKEDQKLARSFLQKIQTLYASKKQTEAGEADHFKWKWMLANELSKLKESYRPERKNKTNFVTELIKDYTTTLLNDKYKEKSIRNTNYDFMALLNIASRWAELEYRTQVQ